ncbi:hypothetical protein STEG23_023476 [Scotinomys teguina]
MARKAGQGKEEEESRARQQEEKTPVREEEKRPVCDGRGHHVVEQGLHHQCYLWKIESSDKNYANEQSIENSSQETMQPSTWHLV